MNKRVLPFLAILVLPALADPAWSQGTGMRAPTRDPSVPVGPQRQSAPVALPGLASRPAIQPIPAEPGQNLAPNAMLFDAINRGDIAAARDAVGRGADLGSRNPLGLTPIDAAVDQGRNDIAFFLLSARGTVGPQMRAPTGANLATPSLGADMAAPPPGRGRSAAAAMTVPPRNAPRGSVVQPVLQPRLWANDGGAPQPDAGFLGFDAGRPAGAVAPDAPRRGRG
ncbi:hypothetical protein ACQW02_07795 [Humitalea sp. 24SJ18S-53]|uniref:hypothetical protein n=1 Tax=Humitalea sp. 24SJ18S-53 TaxID=3422307 RepID=UPI003D673AA6